MNSQGQYEHNPENPEGGFGGLFPIGQEGMKYMYESGRKRAEGFIARLFNASEFRKYFAVSTDYVLNKLKLILFPYTYPGSWQRASIQITEQGDNYPPPRADINAPDLYIPVMGFVTYIVFCAMVSGFSGEFSPNILGVVATWAGFAFLVDVAVLWVGFYMLMRNCPPVKDCMAFCGYVFVGIALNELAQMIGGKWLLIPSILFTGCGVSVFFNHTLGVILTSDSSPSQRSYDDSGNDSDEHTRRKFFKLFFAALQFVIMFFLAFSPDTTSQSQQMVDDGYHNNMVPPNNLQANGQPATQIPDQF